MSTKRVKIREMKRKRNQQRTMIIAGCIAVVVLVAAAFTWVWLDAYGKSYIMTFEGNKISTNDFRFCGLFASSEESAKEEALDALLTFMVLDKAAKDNNLSLTQEEKDDLLSYSSGLKGYYSQSYGMDLSYITDERMAELFGLNELRKQLVEIYTADYTVDETDYAKALAEYTQNERADYINMPLKYILTSDTEKLAAARKALDEDGMDFDEAVATYSDYYNEETGVDTYQLKEFGLSQEGLDKVLDLQPGDISETVDMDGLYGIFRVESITLPTEEEINTLYRDKYIEQQKENIFNDLVTSWKESADYKLNEKAYNAA